MIKAVLFDYGGVLSTGGKVGSVRSMLAGALGIEETAVQDFGDAFVQSMRGEISDEAFVQTVHQLHPGTKPITIDDMLQHASIFATAPTVYDLARRLRAQGIKTGILSNMFNFGASALRKKGSFDDFNPVLISCDAHCMKPDPKFYQLAVEKLGLPSGEILFIDDQQVMVDGAQRMGLQVLLAQSPAQIVQAVEHLVQEQNGTTL